MIGRLYVEVANMLDQCSRERKIRRELESLTDRELADLGLSRREIDKVAWETSKKK